MTGVLMRERMTHRKPHGRKPCEGGSRVWNNVSPDQGMLRVAGRNQKLGTDKEVLLSMASAGAWFS